MVIEAVEPIPVIEAEWPAAARVRALVTLRGPMVAEQPFSSFNLAAHVGDDAERVADVRRRLREQLALPAEPAWLRQVHGSTVIDASTVIEPVEADGSMTDVPGVVCAVLTADCLPLVLCDRDGGRVAVIHVGWRGLAAGIIESGVTRMNVAPGRVLAWMGPAIGPDAFEVGDDVRQALGGDHPDAESALRPSTRDGHWLADLYTLALGRLMGAGIARSAVYGGHWCTFTDNHRFYSYRRDGRTGRMATLAWIESRQG